jgi:hypothetical protein
LFGPALNYLPSWQTIGTIALTVGVVVGSTALLILVPGAGPVLFAVGIASLGVTGALTAYNVGDRICNQQQNGPQAILGAVGDVTGIGSLVTGITGRDLATLRHLGLTDAQQRQLITDGGVGTLLTAVTLYLGVRGFMRGRAATALAGRGPNGRPMFAADWEALLSERYGAGNVERVPQVRSLAGVLEGHPPGQGFTGVFDSATGKIGLSPSTAEPVLPPGFVPRSGGHGIVSDALGGDAANHSGFAVIIQEDGTLRVTWRSGTLNNTPDSLVPENLRPQIIQTIEQQLGRTVSSN